MSSSERNNNSVDENQPLILRINRSSLIQNDIDSSSDDEVSKLLEKLQII
jgi:hypothetical protein